MKNIIYKALVTLFFSSALVFSATPIVTAAAAPAAPTPSTSLFENSKTEACNGTTLTETTPGSPANACANQESTISGLMSTTLNVLSIVVSVITVIMIIIGGLKYITSQGDSAAISSAKNTIIYAIIGIVIVAFSQVIVRFALNRARPLPKCPAGTTQIKKPGDCIV